MANASGFWLAALLAAALALPAAAAPTRPKPAVVARPKPAAVPPARPATIAPLPATPEIAALRRAFRFGFAPYEMLRTRALQASRVAAAGLGSGINMLVPRLTLADAGTRDVTTPNNDTLYASAWLDLSGGPVLISIPPLPRYHSAALMGITSDVAAIIGTRSHGAAGGRYAITGPGWQGDLPAGVERVNSPTNDAWLLVRVVVNGPDDLAAAADGLTRFQLSALGPARPLDVDVPALPDGRAFITAVNTAIARSGDARLAARAAGFAGEGIGRDWDTLPDDLKARWNASLPALIAELKGALLAGAGADGWAWPPPNMAQYGDDDDLRSTVALGGLAALPPAEAVYVPTARDGSGAVLTGAKSWRLRLPAGIPAGAFWSLTMYEQAGDGRLFFVPNALDRYAVGSRSAHLRPDRDGSIELFIQHRRPSGERVVNWLPAPKGPFVLMFRAYLPGPAMLDGRFRLPPVLEGEAIP